MLEMGQDHAIFRIFNDNENFISSCRCETLLCIFRKLWFNKIIVIIINDKFNRMRAILSMKYLEKELHNVSNEDCSGSAFNFCRCRITFTDFHIWRGFSEFVEIKFV